MVGSRVILLSAALAPVPPHAPPAWQWPLRPPPRVVRGFSPPAHPWEAGHRGVDLAARPGRPVYAAGPGRVGFAGDLAGRGVVTIVHRDLRTTYLPVRPAVHAGQRVRAGDRIGVVAGDPGHCAGEVCLHWGLLRGTTYLDPLSLLGLGPVRLLPWWPAAGTASPAGPPAVDGGPPATGANGDPLAAPPSGEPPVPPPGSGRPPTAPSGDLPASLSYRGPSAATLGTAMPDAGAEGPPTSSGTDAGPAGRAAAAGRHEEAGSPRPRRGDATGAARTGRTERTERTERRASRSLAARLAGAASCTSADLIGGIAALAALAALSALRTPLLAARFRRGPRAR